MFLIWSTLCNLLCCCKDSANPCTTTCTCTWSHISDNHLFDKLFDAPGDTPSLLTLRRFPGKRRKFNVLEGIGTHYRDFGTFLLDDRTGMKVAAIETARLRVSSLILQDVFEEWLLGRGKLPVTYATLVECLRAVELNVLADDILDVLQ